MLQINHLYKNYGKFQAVRDLNLHVPKGDLFGFVGPNGAGKTTTIRMVCGLMPPTEGTITIHGVDALQHPKEIKKQIGYVPDFFGVYDNLKVSEYMDFYGSMYRMTSREITAVSNDLLELVNLSDKKEVYVDTLSRGMKQRLCVARALIHNPSLLVLDEPNSGLEPACACGDERTFAESAQHGKNHCDQFPYFVGAGRDVQQHRYYGSRKTRRSRKHRGCHGTCFRWKPDRGFGSRGDGAGSAHA